MNDGVKLIFKGLQYSIESIGKMKKAFSKQNRFNRTVVIFSIITSVNLMVKGSEIKKLTKKITDMDNEIKEIKNVKGE
jgi:hypothetical protein